jgi:hypothetical protein
MAVHPSPRPSRRDPFVGSVQERQAGLPEPRMLQRRLLAGSSPTAAHTSPFWPVDHREDPLSCGGV